MVMILPLQAICWIIRGYYAAVNDVADISTAQKLPTRSAGSFTSQRTSPIAHLLFSVMDTQANDHADDRVHYVRTADSSSIPTACPKFHAAGLDDADHRM